jgi:tripartite-type tricarboxylate transporter receptor subunit TctC
MRRILLALTCLVGGLLAAVPAMAQEWPTTRPIRLLVGFPPGGGVDLLARVIGERVGAALGQVIVIENRPGQAATLATEVGMRSPPDGYTLTMANIGTMTLNPALSRNYPIDPERDVQPISRLVTYSLFCFVPADGPRTLAEFIADARARPGAVNYGSAGAGGITHVAPEIFARAAGVTMTHVPYRGSAPAITDVAAGRINLQMDIWGVGEGNVQAGRVRALATSAAQRSSLAPDVPTAREAGLDWSFSGWQAIVAPRGTPRPIVDRLNAEIRRILADPDVVRRLAAQGNEPAPSTPEELGALIASDRRRMGEVIRALGITAD